MEKAPRAGRTVLLGLGLFALLGLVAAASRVHHVPGTSTHVHGTPKGVGNYLFTLFVLVLVVGFVVLLFIWFTEREALVRTRRARQGRGMYKALALVLILGLLASILARLGWRPPHFLHRNSPGKAHLGSPAKSHSKRISPNASHPPTLEWLPVVIVTAAGLTVLGYIGLRAARRSRRHLLDEFMLEQQLEALLDDTLDDLYATKDPRKAIIAAYAKMEKLFASSGVPREPSEAPLEYLGRALGELRASGAALGRLTGLFQWAKFSEHTVDESMRAEAIDALTQVRDELRAKREEDRAHREQAERLRSEQEALRGDATPGEDPFVAAAERAKGSIYGRRGF